MELARRGVTIFLGVLVAGAVMARDAQAQTEKVPDGPFAVQVDGALTVGHTTSSAAGFELGWWPTDDLKVFVESSWMMNVASASLDARAKIIADSIAGMADMAEPAVMVDAGLRYSFGEFGWVQPFVLAGFGLARVNVTPGFLVGGTDVTDRLLGTYGVRLGRDLDGHVTKGAVVVGAGVNVPLTSRYFVEGSARYGRILSIDSAVPGDVGTNTTRIQVSFGARF